MPWEILEIYGPLSGILAIRKRVWHHVFESFQVINSGIWMRTRAWGHDAFGARFSVKVFGFQLSLLCAHTVYLGLWVMDME